MAEDQPREVGAYAWGGRLPPSETRRLRAAAPAPPAARSVDVRDAVALGLIVAGTAGATTCTVALFGWLALGLVASLGAVAAGIMAGLRP